MARWYKLMRWRYMPSGQYFNSPLSIVIAGFALLVAFIILALEFSR